VVVVVDMVVDGGFDVNLYLNLVATFDGQSIFVSMSWSPRSA
jgi:hypothetical protein